MRAAQSVFEDPRDILAKTPSLSSFGELGLKGKRSLTRSPVRNQGPEDICWGYTISGLAEDQFALKNPGRFVQADPEYLNFYHVLLQMQNNLGYFRNIIKYLDKLPPGKRKATMDEAVEEAYGLIRKKPNREALKFWTPDQGNFESTALEEADLVGMMPYRRFGGVRKTGQQEALFEDAIKRFLGEHFLNAKELDTYVSRADDKINDRLYQQLSSKLKPYLGAKPPRPKDTFIYNRQTHTAQSFMRKEMGFDPKEYKTFIATPETHELALRAVKKSMDLGYTTPFGIPIYGDKISGTQDNFQQLIQESGVFTPVYCPDGKCTEINGAHEIRGTNYFHIKDKITAFIFQNSWNNNVGRTATGRMAKNGRKRGYWILTTNYLADSFAVKDPWDFTIPKVVADMPEFAELKKESYPNGPVE